MKTLQKLSEYVKTRYGINNFDEDILKEIVDYTNFIIQPLTLSHFVPALFRDGVWEVLENPYGNGMIDKYSEKCKEYQTALENVIFKDFEVNIIHGYINRKGDILPFMEINTEETIESIIPYNLEITDKIAEKFKI